MTSEPKSIFTSKRDFEKDFGSLPERLSPNNNVAPPTLAPSSLADSSIVRETGPQADAGEPLKYARRSSVTAGIAAAVTAAVGNRSRGNSLTSSQTQPPFNASQAVHDPIPTSLTNEHTFRKPDVPLPQTLNTTSTNASTLR